MTIIDYFGKPRNCITL